MEEFQEYLMEKEGNDVWEEVIVFLCRKLDLKLRILSRNL